MIYIYDTFWASEIYDYEVFIVPSLLFSTAILKVLGVVSWPLTRRRLVMESGVYRMNSVTLWTENTVPVLRFT